MIDEKEIPDLTDFKELSFFLVDLSLSIIEPLLEELSTGVGQISDSLQKNKDLFKGIEDYNYVVNVEANIKLFKTYLDRCIKEIQDVETN